MPLHRTRLRERGFNQAVELARPLVRRLGIPLAADLVERVRPGQPQSSLHKSAASRTCAARSRCGARSRPVTSRSSTTS